MNWWRAQTTLGNRSSKKVGNNTYLHKISEDTFGVRLHATDVVQIHFDDTYTLNSGGWRTRTTKDRINSYSPARVWQRNSIWYVGDGIIFEDGMKVDSTGNPIGEFQSTTKVEEKKRKLDKMVKQYIDGFAKSVSGKGINDPSGGDCWGCYFGLGEYSKVKSQQVDKPIGPELMGLDHLVSHFEDKYYVPSLVFKAIMDRGYRVPEVIWHSIQSDLKEGKTTQLKDVLRAYFRKRKIHLMEYI